MNTFAIEPGTILGFGGTTKVTDALPSRRQVGM